MYRILEGDVTEQLKTLGDASVDSIVTDPPYGLEFMGKEWDAPWKNRERGNEGTRERKTDHRQPFDGSIQGGAGTPFLRSQTRSGNGASYGADQRVMQALQDWHFAWATEALRVLKPGGHLLAFGGSRTYHRLACAVEDAGFEIRDQIMWIYGSGFPKSLDVSKAMERQGTGNREQGTEKARATDHCPLTTASRWRGWGTALKPAHEPIVVARKPLTGTVAANVLQHGTGALNIDGCRVGEFVNATPPGTDRYNAANFAQGYRPSAYGRDGEASAEQRYATTGSTNFSLLPGPRGGAPEGRWPANVIHDGSEEVTSLLPESKPGSNTVKRSSGAEREGNKGAAYGAESRPAGTPMIFYGDEGSASRFFYCPKADREERDKGTREQGSKGNTHPTVKPVDLMAYLCRLVTPAGGVVLDCFLGSGTTGIAALREGFNFIGIERNPAYVEIAQRRIEGDAPLFNAETGTKGTREQGNEERRAELFTDH